VNAFLDKLPTVLVLAVLVGVFVSLRKHSPSSRMRLWIYAWALIFVHFLIEGFETRTGTLEKIFESIDIGALELSGIVFVVSMIQGVEMRLRRRTLLAVLGLPVAIHAVAVVFGWSIPRTLSAVIAAGFLAAVVSVLLCLPERPFLNVSLAGALVVAGITAMHYQLQGSPDFAINAILSLSFFLCGVFFWHRFPRLSPGVIVVTGGFLAWGMVWPVACLVGAYFPNLQLNPEIWNVPKFFVAFGMVLALLEDKSLIIERAHRREHAENRLLLNLSQITSRLLAGKDPAALCAEITAAITDSTSFSGAALMLANDSGALHLSGASGYSPQQAEELQSRAACCTTEKVRALCTAGTRLGNNAYRISEDGGGVVIPLVSSRGSHLGCLWLQGSPEAPDSGSAEVMKLEVLATDLAVTMENTRLHNRLVRSEKLAALGQLVAGVAHELNNPLTGILGYSDLLSEEAEKPAVKKRVEKLGNEARRMKRIVDGLLRFARQNNPAARAADIEAALRDVVQLREYHVRKLGIQMHVDVEPMLPPIAIGEDELKQVLLNILNNAIDAVEESRERLIRIRAHRHAGRVVVHFEDSGPGFTDVNRAFDPFYTTKAVGKGTGLGLSICYGIAQECGGEISLANRQPYGASVVLEFPATVPAAVSVPAAVLHA
jgi:two-component system, NtrC family, sensor kinase